LYLSAYGPTINAMEPKREELLAELFGSGGVPPMLAGRLLRTREVAQLFQVSERTVAEWARRGRIPSVRTPGGHRLYPADQVRRLLVATENGEVATDGAAEAVVDVAT
jgi:excisionase family DNA binding protein